MECAQAVLCSSYRRVSIVKTPLRAALFSRSEDGRASETWSTTDDLTCLALALVALAVAIIFGIYP